MTTDEAAKTIVHEVAKGNAKPPRNFDDARRLVTTYIGAPQEIGHHWHKAVSSELMQKIYP